MKNIFSFIVVIAVIFILGFSASATIKADISPVGQYDACEGTCGCQPKTQAPVVTENAVINECGQSSGASITGNTVTAFAWNESATLSEDGTTLSWQDGSNWIRTLATPTPTPTEMPTPTPTPASTCSDMPPNECAVCCANEHRIRQAKCKGNARCTLDSVRQLLACHTTCTFQ